MHHNRHYRHLRHHRRPALSPVTVAIALHVERSAALSEHRSDDVPPATCTAEVNPDMAESHGL